MLDPVKLWRCPSCGHASDRLTRCYGPRLWRHEPADCELVAYVPADEKREAVSLAEICEYLRSTTMENPATGRDRRIPGWKSAADALEARFGKGK